MVLYVVYKATKNYSNRSLIPSRLRAIGCNQIRKTFWEFDRPKVSKVLELLEENEPIILKRTTTIRKRSIVEGRVQDLGSLIVVSIKTSKEKKDKTRNFVKRAPCIRLGRCLYAFYQRHSQFDPECKLINVDRLASFMRKIGGDVKMFPKLVIVNEPSLQILVDDTKQQMRKEILSILENCRRLYEKHRSDKCDRNQFLSSLQKLKRQYIIARRKAMYYKKWMGFDFSKNLMKAYRALSKLKHYPRKQRLMTQKYSYTFVH